MPSTPNIFARLRKWALRQDENYLTESLSVILEMLLERVPDVGVRLVKTVTNGFINTKAENATIIEIRTQVETAEGRPDLEIRVPDHLAVIEVKAESPVRRGQLEGYREYLRTTEFAHTLLVLLTKYPPVLPKDAEQPDYLVRWHELSDWIELELVESNIVEPICRFLCQQFYDFLKERNMTIAQVGWQLPEGTRALRNLINMLFEAAVSIEAAAGKDKSVKLSGGADYLGIKFEGNKYWAGVLFKYPEKIHFCTECRIDPEGAHRLVGEGNGEVEEKGGIPWRWWYGTELDSEEAHFFARSKVSQMQWLMDFLRDCLAKARSIETPDQPPIPDEPEEN